MIVTKTYSFILAQGRISSCAPTDCVLTISLCTQRSVSAKIVVARKLGMVCFYYDTAMSNVATAANDSGRTSS